MLNSYFPPIFCVKFLFCSYFFTLEIPIFWTQDPAWHPVTVKWPIKRKHTPGALYHDDQGLGAVPFHHRLRFLSTMPQGPPQMNRRTNKLKIGTEYIVGRLVEMYLLRWISRIGGNFHMTIRFTASLLHLQLGHLHRLSPVIFSSLAKCKRQSWRKLIYYYPFNQTNSIQLVRGNIYVFAIWHLKNK